MLCSRFSDNFRSKLRGALGVNADEFTFLALVLKFDEALDQREQRVVFAPAYVVAGLPLCAALPCNDIAAENVLATEFLETEPLRV